MDGEREVMDVQSPDMSETVGPKMTKDGKRGGGDWELQQFVGLVDFTVDYRFKRRRAIVTPELGRNPAYRETCLT